ncbi:MAG TPA: FAD-dependent oxidoreductase, partial [Magnetospirillaceae bacterium]|nr:FAD-dependent oxidoreductase [Magnetospirillaceae bacterium]
MDLRKRAMRIGAWTAVIMVAMAALLAGCAHAREADPVAGGLTFKAGTYTATVPGMMGDIKVEVIFSVDRILSVRVLEHRETPVLSDAAVKGLPARIVESQSLAVDSVSGVTITSDAILEAVAECVRKAGGDVDALKARKVAAVQRAPNVRQTVDVVVIGGGGAGLSAAVTAHQAGASVLVLEKMPQVGGNTIIAAGAFNTSNLGLQRRLPAAPGPEAAIMAAINAQPASDLHREMQAQLRREFEAHRAAGSPHLFDSPTFHALQTFEGGDRKGDLALIRNYTSQSLDALKWLEGLGMRFTDTPFTVLGALWMRSHRPVRPLGTG